MKVDFNFGTTVEITLTPESPKEEALIKMCYETNVNPVIIRNGDNKIRIQFTEFVLRKTTSIQPNFIELGFIELGCQEDK
jgi:hypothetical protein